MAAAWGEPWTFGVPGANGSEFFRELGFDPGVPVATSNPEIIKRYNTRKDGKRHGSTVSTATFRVGILFEGVG